MSVELHDLIGPSEDWAIEHLIEKLEGLKDQYFTANFQGTDADGDGVEGMEKDNYCILIENVIDALKRGDI